MSLEEFPDRIEKVDSGGKKCFFGLLARGLDAFCLLLKPISFFTFSTKLPNNALWAELAVGARIRAGFTIVKAFLTITDFHLLARDGGFASGMISALHAISLN